MTTIDATGGVAGLLGVLQTGDVLLYRPAGFFGRGIAIKTWSDYSHCELFIGADHVARLIRRGKLPIGGAVDAYGQPIVCWASRDPTRWLPWPVGGGVSFYPLRTSQLAVVRRPREPINVDALLDFCAATKGQAYDWWGLARFFTIGKGKTDRMFCSEAVTRALRVAGPVLFDNRDADQVSPGMLDQTRDLMDIWRDVSRESEVLRV
jgi:hypothetical protein